MREKFLEQMDAIAPQDRWHALVEPDWHSRALRNADLAATRRAMTLSVAGSWASHLKFALPGATVTAHQHSRCAP